jgi:predicted signal transduction protein with EAL and GGDEF domain
MPALTTPGANGHLELFRSRSGRPRYSALSRLRGFPFHTLKIDRAFVSEIVDHADEAPIVAAMIAMAHAMKLDVVAPVAV